MIEVKGLTKAFGDLKVLTGASFEVQPGKTFALLGGSGSGKTVLMKHLEGLIRPDAGSVSIDGCELSTLAPDELATLRQALGVQFQAGALFDSMSVFDNIAFPLREQGHLDEGEVKKRVDHALELLGLEEAAGKLPGDLSGGMKKRVAFARAMGLRPKVLLADEPTAGLDPLTTEAVTDAILAARDELGATAFVITHDLPTAFRIADVIALLHEGKVIEAAAPDDFKASSHPAVRAFLKDWLEKEEAARAM